MTAMEIFIELFKTLEHLLHVTSWVHQVRNSKMIGALLLAEAGPWHRHNARLIDHLKAVDEVRCLSLLFGLVDELLTKVYLWEAVHGALNLRARHLLHIVESAGEKLSTLLEPVEDRIVLICVLLDVRE